MLSHRSLRLFIFLKSLFFRVVISIDLSIELLVTILTLEFPFRFCFIVSRDSLSVHSVRPCFPLIFWIWSQKLLWSLPKPPIWAAWSQFLLTGFFSSNMGHIFPVFLLVNNSGFCYVEDFWGSLCGFWFSFCFGLLGFYSSSRQLTFLDSTANLSLLCCAAANISVSLFRISIRCFFSLTLYCLPYTCMIWQTKCLGRDSVQIWGHSIWFPYTWRFPLNFQSLCRLRLYSLAP